MSRLLARSLLTWDSAMSALSSASSSSCCTLRNLDRLVLACSSYEPVKGRGDSGEENSGMSSQVLLVHVPQPLLTQFLQQPSQGCPVWHSPQTCSVFKTRHRYPLPGMNLCCPACSVRIHIHCIYSSCASDRCLQTWGFSAHLCSSTPHPHVPVHPSVFFYPGFLSRPNANSWPLAVLHLNALPWSYGIWTVSN